MTDQIVNLTHAVGRERLLGHLAMLGFALLIAFSFSLGKLATPYIDAQSINALRFVIAVGVMGGFIFGIKRVRFVVPRAPWRFAILGALMAVYFETMFFALEITAPVSTSAIYTLLPLMTAVFAWLTLRQHVRTLTGLSLVLGAAGAIWVIFHGDLGALLAFRIGQGEIIFFFGCVAHALYAPLIRKFDRRDGVLVSAFWIIAFTALWIILFGLPNIAATAWTGLPPIVWLTAAYLGIFTSVVTFSLMQYATMRLPASKVLAYGYLVPVIVILIEGVLGHGWVGLSVVIGALVTVMGLVVLYLSPD